MVASIRLRMVRGFLTVVFLAGSFVDSRAMFMDSILQALEKGAQVEGHVDFAYTVEKAVEGGSLVSRREHYEFEAHSGLAIQEDEPRRTLKEVARESEPDFTEWLLGEVTVNENVVQELYQQPCGEFLFCDQRSQFCDYSTDICEPCSAICPDRPGSSWCSELCPVVHKVHDLLA